MKNNVLYILAIIILGLFVVFKPLLEKKFYGFEYEDSFVSVHVSSQENISDFIVSYRTMGCEILQECKCTSVSSYTGHYATYSIYLSAVKKIFSVQQNHLIHKVGNALLFFICFFIVFLFYKDSFNLFIVYLGLISSLPVLYVLNSGLIENISFAVGLILILFLYKFKITKKNIWLILYLILLSVIINIKRENLIFLSSLMILNPRNLMKKYIFWIGMSFVLLSQLVINPFYTEGLEAGYLGRDTFSVEYFKFQFPTYLAAFFRIDGFLLILILIFGLTKPSKDSYIFLAIWFLLIISYGFHYRGQYAIIAGKITHFETFRYMFNTLPLLIGYFLFGARRTSINRVYVVGVTFFMCVFLLYKNIPTIKEFASEELLNYHQVNDKLNLFEENRKDVVIHDNFVLVSMLNNVSKCNYVMSATNDNINFIHGKSNILINRFGILNLEEFKNKYFFKKIDSLSTKGASVFSFEKVF